MGSVLITVKSWVHTLLRLLRRSDVSKPSVSVLQIILYLCAKFLLYSYNIRHCGWHDVMLHYVIGYLEPITDQQNL